MPPPKVNFDKLSDILKKRRGVILDVTSSGALAASLDKCVVCFQLTIGYCTIITYYNVCNRIQMNPLLTPL
jgi:hypothetical protein